MRERSDKSPEARQQAEHDRRSIGQVVLELQPSHPDVTPSSLRFLEREGLLEPMRTPGGHRLYSANDVERVRRIKAWQMERLSLAEIRQRLQSLHALRPPADLAAEFVRYAAQGDLPAAGRVVLRADELGMPLAQLFQDILTPALYKVGELWACGDLIVAQEKEISELARDLIAELSLRHASPEPTGPVVVAACVEGEQHDLGLRMACALLRSRGWRVHFLGADVAPAFLAEAVLLHRPALALLSAADEARWSALQTTIAAIRAGEPNIAPTIVVGGQIANERIAELLDEQDALVVDRLDCVAAGSLDEALRACATAIT